MEAACRIQAHCSHPLPAGRTALQSPGTWARCVVPRTHPCGTNIITKTHCPKVVAQNLKEVKQGQGEGLSSGGPSGHSHCVPAPAQPGTGPYAGPLPSGFTLPCSRKAFHSVGSGPTWDRLPSGQKARGVRGREPGLAVQYVL